MELFATDRDRLAFLLETDAALDLDFEALEAQAGMVAEEAAVVERIFRWAAEGRNLPAIAKALREENAPTRNGGAWRPSTIRGMLRNRFYTGRVEFNGGLIRAQHDAVVSDMVFEKVAAL